MFAYFVIAAVLPAIIVGQARYPIIPCPGDRPVPHDIRIVGCTESPCHVQRASTVSFQHDFTANENSATLRMEIEQTVFGETTMFPLPEILANACNWMVGSGCPVVAGQRYTHGSTIPVITEVHGGVPAQLRVSLRNASGTYTGCAAINLVIH